MPRAPGIAGSLAGVLLVLWIGPDPLRNGVFILGVSTLALLTIGPAEHSIGRPDPGPIVIDEVLGMAISLWSVPHGWPWLLTGLLLFRAFDILKPPPLGALERLRSPWGVLLDDVAAGVAVNLLLQGWRLWRP